MIMLLGSKGSMGTRYQAILKFLGKEVCCKDVEDSFFPDEYLVDKIDGVIIATPTDTHHEIIRRYARYKVPILCEKPIVKSSEELKEIYREIGDIPFTMMYQYEHLALARYGTSWYDYFRHGNDGLVWDCLQIISLADGSVNLAEESPIWDCAINEQTIDLNQMDRAYVHSVSNWLWKPARQDRGMILDAHVKTEELARSGRFG